MADGLRMVIRTPHDTVLDELVDAARVPTSTGQVGLRPRQEPSLMVVDPGLVVLTIGTVHKFAATAGGLLESDRDLVVLATPFAVVGDHGSDVLSALDRAYDTPDGELNARRRLGELERRIVEELRPPHQRMSGGG